METEEDQQAAGGAEPRPTTGVRPEDQERDRVTLISDPGRTSYLVRRVLDERSRREEPHVISHHQTLLPLRPDGTLDTDRALQWAREQDDAITVIVTEIPRVGSNGPKLVELHFAERLAIISLPAIGPARITRGLRREIDRALTALDQHDSDFLGDPELGWRVERDGDLGAAYITHRHSLLARMGMTLGIAVGNEPWLALPQLSGVFAAASATGAFGVFFGSIWGIAEALPVWRLAGISILSMIVLMTWLLVSHRLWDGPGSSGGHRMAAMYTAGTVLSLLFSVMVLYLGLFAAILLVGLLLIDPAYMAQTQGLDGTLMNYIDIAWLSASMGTVAGAIGSGFDDDAQLENLTQGSRERQRYPRDAEQR